MVYRQIYAVTKKNIFNKTLFLWLYKRKMKRNTIWYRTLYYTVFKFHHRIRIVHPGAWAPFTSLLLGDRPDEWVCRGPTTSGVPQKMSNETLMVYESGVDEIINALAAVDARRILKRTNDFWTSWLIDVYIIHTHIYTHIHKLVRKNVYLLSILIKRARARRQQEGH